MRLWHGLMALAVVGLCASGARADDVTDQINEALQAYQKHDAQTALAALDAAASLLRQSRADSFKALLPAPPAGWTADDAEASAVGPAMLGGGTTASRKYHKGDQQVEVQVIADSPMLQGMAALLGSPFAAAGGMKTVVVGGRRMSFTPDENSYMTIVGGKVIVKIEGDKAVADATLKSFVGAVDFAAIEKLVR